MLDCMLHHPAVQIYLLIAGGLIAAAIRDQLCNPRMARAAGGRLARPLRRRQAISPDRLGGCGSRIRE